MPLELQLSWPAGGEIDSISLLSVERPADEEYNNAVWPTADFDGEIAGSPFSSLPDYHVEDGIARLTFSFSQTDWGNGLELQSLLLYYADETSSSLEIN